MKPIVTDETTLVFEKKDTEILVSTKANEPVGTFPCPPVMGGQDRDGAEINRLAILLGILLLLACWFVVGVCALALWKAWH